MRNVFNRPRFLSASLSLLAANLLAAAEPEPRPDALSRFPPVEPRNTLATFEVRPGFHLEIAAHEPEVVDPVALSFDEQGRAYVVEMRDYSERRPERLGRVRLLEDRDADGRFETSRVFLDDLPWPTAITCWDGGVFIGSTPDILYAKDSDKDGRADVREVVFTGFASDAAPYATNQLNVQAMLNSFQWALDCRIHGSSSLSGGRVRLVDSPYTRSWWARGHGLSPDRREPGLAIRDFGSVIDLRGRDFSFDPRSLRLRAETGGGQHGMSFDATGRKFLCSNSDHLQLVRFEDRQARHETAHPLPPALVSIAADGPAAEVFRLSPEEPWRILRTRWRVTGLVSGPIEGGGRASGYFTGATGLTIYRGDAYGPEYSGDAFVADCGSNLIHRKKLRPLGVELIGERPADEKRSEFIASRDTWFRPVQFALAPDGCLWVLDMYREIIEHPWSLPANLKRLLDLNAGHDRGRLYRIVANSSTPRRRVSLGSASLDDLVRFLDHPNGWHRETASRLLCERQDHAAVPLLRAMLRESSHALGRLHALQVLDAYGQCDPEALATALADASPDVRRHGLRLAEMQFAGLELPANLLARLPSLAEDEPLVRLQLALAVAAVQLPDRLDLVLRLIRSTNGRAGEELITEAALAAVGDDVLPCFRSLVALSDPALVPNVVPDLAEMLGRRNRAPEVVEAISLLGRLPINPKTLRIVARLADGLRRAGSSLAEADPDGRLRGIQAFTQDTATRPTTGEEAGAGQLDAVRLLEQWPSPESRRTQWLVLEGAHSSDAKRIALEGLLRSGDVKVFHEVLGRWDHLEPDLRRMCLDTVLRRSSGPKRILDALAAHQIRVTDLATAQASALRSQSDLELRQRAWALLGAPAISRTEAVVATLPALDFRGDPERGRVLYETQCAQCHRLGGKGHALGPDLESVRSQPKEQLLVAIVDPNREVAPSFMATTIETRDGETWTGLLANDTPALLALRQASGLVIEVERSKVLDRRTEGRSLMPDGFEATLSAQDFADLLSCLTEDVNPRR